MLLCNSRLLCQTTTETEDLDHYIYVRVIRKFNKDYRRRVAMRLSKAAQALFVTAAVWNLISGVPFALWPGSTAKAYALLGKTPGAGEQLFVQFSGACQALLGIGYGLAALYPETFGSIIFLGAIAKLNASLLFLRYSGKGLVRAAVATAGTVELAFAAGFIWWLLQQRSSDFFGPRRPFKSAAGIAGAPGPGPGQTKLWVYVPCIS